MWGTRPEIQPALNISLSENPQRRFQKRAVGCGLGYGAANSYNIKDDMLLESSRSCASVRKWTGFGHGMVSASAIGEMTGSLHITVWKSAGSTTMRFTEPMAATWAK